jgi:predicted metal-binding membrane protein
MSVAWMVFVAAMIAAEKLLPWKAAATRTVAAALGIAVAPTHGPGLTIPRSNNPVQMHP